MSKRFPENVDALLFQLLEVIHGGTLILTQ